MYVFKFIELLILFRNKKKLILKKQRGRFYRSQTYKTLTQVENGLWAENAEYILDRYNEEK